jgi:hypothetical protein
MKGLKFAFGFCAVFSIVENPDHIKPGYLTMFAKEFKRISDYHRISAFV